MMCRAPQGTNDDKILSCCLHYCQDKARDYMPKNKRMCTERDDMNVMQKSYSPTVDIMQYVPLYVPFVSVPTSSQPAV